MIVFCPSLFYQTWFQGKGFGCKNCFSGGTDNLINGTQERNWGESIGGSDHTDRL